MASGNRASGEGGGWPGAPNAALRSGVRLVLSPGEDFDAACADLEQQASAHALRALAVTVEVDRTLTVPELRRLEEMLLDRHGAHLLQVVEVEAAPPQPAEGPADAAKGPFGVGTRRRRPEPAGRGAMALNARGGFPRLGGKRAARRRGRMVEPLPPRVGARVADAPGGGADGMGAVVALAPSVSTRPPEPAVTPASALPTILVKRTLRSGQRVRFAGNVVVVGDVNPGAEIVADGDIVVMGTLRGVAHAGATGGGDATVTAFMLQPTQLRLGAVIGRSPDGRAPRPDAPEVARLRDGTLVVERYVPQ